MKDGQSGSSVLIRGAGISLIAGMISYLWSCFSTWLIIIFVPPEIIERYSAFSQNNEIVRSEFANRPLVLLFFILVIAPFAEEWLYRAPLVFFENAKLAVKIFFALVLAGFFGYAHGGLLHIATQGVSGIVFACAFLMNGPRLRSGYFGAVGTHFVHNLLVTLSLSLASRIPFDAAP